MIPRRAMSENAAVLIGADTANLAAATPFVAMALVKAPFTPSPDVGLGTALLADFDGSDPIHADSAVTQVGVDPLTGDSFMSPRPPAGGWRWITTGITNLPQTIYGYVIVDAAETTLIASALFDNPITLTDDGQEIILGTDETVIRLPLSAMS